MPGTGIMPGAEPFSADGEPVGVLLVHGFTGTPQSLRPWAEYLAAAGLTVRLPRLPGHGTKWSDLNRTTWEDWYGEAERGLDELHERCAAVFAMGLSMGGTVVLRLAERRGADLAGVVVVNPSVLTLRKDAKLLPLFRLLVPSFPGIASDIKKPGSVELAYDRTPLRGAYSLSRLWRLVRADLASVTLPLLLITSRDDHVVEPKNGEVVWAGISSSDRRRLVLDNSYHVATLDNDAETIFTESLAFVRDQVATRPAG
ncbi:MAG TPA: alpha/beta fold hydrolase [Mycobacteriales bacterium]|nr:alpha/beta fold hydrolase [Mycobacteriales bacterium]